MADETAATELATLLDLVARRDERAFAALFGATSRWVYGLCFRILHDGSAAEEAALDTFLQVWQKADTYQPWRGSPTAWLATLARSRAIDRLRSGAPRKRHEEPFARGFDAAAPGPPPDSSAVQAETRSRVLAALSGLPPEQARAIELAFFQGLTHAEIAAKLEEPIGTVKTRIRLGMMKLRATLKPFEELT